MVFFSCDGCGEMLKKSRVDAHAARCNRCESVSCVDCSISFWGDDYRNHTSCITEAERYEKTVYTGPKKNDTNRKLTPQEKWQAIIREALERAPSGLKSYLEQIIDLDNVPRKEKQFRNFASNSLRLNGYNGDSTLSAIWKHIDGIKQESMLRKTIEVEKVKDEQDSGKDKTVTCKAEVTDDSDDVQNNVEVKPAASQKIVKKTMKKALKKAPQCQLKMKELRKILLKSSNLDKMTVKKLMQQILNDNPKKMTLEGKQIKWIKK